tara:strand:- start:15013 stop:15534 length:522 start_codon:yes stop_codon:yes gene_type:complete
MNLKITKFSKSRISWGLLLVTSTLILLSALYFQYVKDMTPCYLCIIQRIGVIGLIIGSLIGLIKPINNILRRTAYIISLSGLTVSLVAAIKLVYMQFNPPLFASCGMKATDLLEQYSILEALPVLFQGSASCTKSAGSFLGVNFEIWTLILFSFLAIILFSFFFFRIYKYFKN